MGIGNIKEQSFEEIYYNSTFAKELRNEKTNKGCEGCAFEKTCNGGLKCLSYALTGSPFVKDPGCWR